MRHLSRSGALLTSLAVLGVTVAPVLAQVTPVSAAKAVPTCAPSAFRLSYESNIRSQGWLPYTIFLGWVRFNNTGETCSLPNSKVVLRTEVGTTTHHTPAGSSESVSLLRSVTVKHGGFTSIYVSVSATEPKGWKPGYCTPLKVVGLQVSSHSKSWPHQFVAFTKPRSVCENFHISA